MKTQDISYFQPLPLSDNICVPLHLILKEMNGYSWYQSSHHKIERIHTLNLVMISGAYLRLPSKSYNI